MYSGIRRLKLSEEKQNQLQAERVCCFDESEEGYVNPNEFVILESAAGDRSILARHHTNGKIALLQSLESPSLPARNREQALAQELLYDKRVSLVTMAGPAGTGKTLIAVAAGLDLIERGDYSRMIITRPVTPMGKDLGYLPGTLEEKMEPWIAPIKDNLTFLLSKGRKSRKLSPATIKRNLDALFSSGVVNIEALAYIRGRSLPNLYLIVDEAQNLDAASLKTILTRAGDNTKIVLTGDLEQVDNRVETGFGHVIEKFASTELAGHMLLTKGERSPLATLASKIL